MNRVFPIAKKSQLLVLTRGFIALVAGFSYSSAICFWSGIPEHIATVVFVGFLVGLFFELFAKLRAGINGSAVLLAGFISVVGIHIGSLAGIAISHSPDSMLWMPDTYTSHLPGALEVVKRLSGDTNLVGRIPLSELLLTHWFVGAFFYLFGSSPIVSGLALLTAKLGATLFVYLIGRDLFGNRQGVVAALIYGLVPTILFYTLTYYKEAIVQLLVAGALWGLIISKSVKKWPIFVGGFCLISLIVERFYLVPFLVIPALVVFFHRAKRKASASVAYWTLFSILLIAAVFFWRHGQQYLGSDIFRILGLTRDSMNALNDVDPAFNRDLFYPFAVIKTCFTPFFSIRKFSLFSDFSYLLLWGSFVSQVVTAFALLQGFLAIRRDWQSHLLVWAPVIGFILIVAYVAPYSGRQRDSIYPVFAVYAAAFICRRYQAVI